MSLHHSYLIALSALFVVVFTIMIFSLARHRRAGGAAARFSGPTGTGQWLWAMVPIAILVSVDLALIDAAGERPPLAAPTITLAAAPPAAEPADAGRGARP